MSLQDSFDVDKHLDVVNNSISLEDGHIFRRPLDNSTEYDLLITVHRYNMTVNPNKFSAAMTQAQFDDLRGKISDSYIKPDFNDAVRIIKEMDIAVKEL
jgi:hypothetical protein